MWTSARTCLCACCLACVPLLGAQQPPAPLWKPADSVGWAAQDVLRLPADQRIATRYLDLGDVPEKLRPDLTRVLRGHLQSLSRGVTPYYPEVVPGSGGALLRIDLRHYRWKYETFGALADFSTSHHVRVKDGKKETSAYAPWLSESDGGKAMATLSQATQSRAAIVSGLYFLWQTAAQEGREGAGYYDFLQVADEKSFQALIRFNPKTAAGLEHFRMAAFSGVTQEPRRMEIDATVLGDYCHTKDSAEAIGKKNPLNVLDGELEFDASEQFAPNGVDWPVWFLANNKGQAQSKAPDSIVGGERRTAKDLRLQVNIDCIHCHFSGKNNGFIDMDSLPIRKLSATEYAKFEELTRRYKRDEVLQHRIAKTRAGYAMAVQRDTGWTPAEYREKVLSFYALYDEARVDAVWAGRAFGLSGEEFAARLQAYDETTTKRYGVSKLLPVLSHAMGGGSIGIRQWREAQYEAWIATRGGR